MKVTKKEVALQHAVKVAELKKNKIAMVGTRKSIMKLSSNWFIRTTANVDFLETEEEMELYYGALVSSDQKMRNYK